MNRIAIRKVFVNVDVYTCDSLIIFQIENYSMFTKLSNPTFFIFDILIIIVNVNFIEDIK